MWAPQKGPQLEAILSTWCDELFFGGAKFGGKSDFLLGDFLQDVPTYGRHWQGIIVRQTMPELEDIIKRSHVLYPDTGAMWAEQKKTWTWPCGASLKMRQMERAEDFYKYNGHSYCWIALDELPQWPSLDGYKLMKGCLRWAEQHVPTKRMRATGNPMGPGVAEVKDYFIDYAPDGYTSFLDPETNMRRMFIPSLPKDNLIGLENDPGYIGRLKGMGSPKLVKALLEGKWDQIIGAFFEIFDTDLHVVQPFAVPASWPRIRSFDWGSAAPFSAQWWAVSNGEQPDLSHVPLEKRPYFPRDCMVMYREWYGKSGPNKGLRMDNKDIAAEIVRLSAGETYADNVASPDRFKSEGGPPIMETFWEAGIPFRRADDKRVAGWQQMLTRLNGYERIPMLRVFSTCSDFRRTLPLLQHDKLNPEDVDGDGEDHSAEAARYCLMARPWIPPDSVKPASKTIHKISLNDLWALRETGGGGYQRI